MKLKHTISILTLFALISSIHANASSRKLVENSELQMAEIGMPGTLVITIWSYASTSSISDQDVCKNAIWGVIFDGVSDNLERRITGKPALFQEKYQTQQKYFDDFFKTGDFLKYVNVAENGYIEMGNVIKLKKGYKIGKIVVVKYDQLRKRLVQDGVIKGLDSGF